LLGLLHLKSSGLGLCCALLHRIDSLLQLLRFLGQETGVLQGIKYFLANPLFSSSLAQSNAASHDISAA
jgi:hypothetical protein